MHKIFRHHFRFHPLFHLLIFPLALAFFVVCLYLSVIYYNEGYGIELVYFGLLSVLILLIGLQSRQVPFRNTKSIIRLEMRLRYLELSGKSFRKLEHDLNMAQIAALRLASDDELLALVEEAVSKKLSAREIRERIKH
jgi:hypothetical protein